MSRILMVLRPPAGGAFRHVRDLSSGLAGQGHEVVVCGPVEHRRADLDVQVVPLALERSVSPVRDADGVRRLAGLMRRMRPDLVHAHGSKGGATARLARLLRPGIPVVHTPHGYPFAGYFERSAERRAYRAVEGALAPLSTRVICVCEAERRLAASIGSASRTRVVYNGVAPLVPGPSHRMRERALGRGPTICAVLELRPGKGVETLIEAMRDVLAAYPEARLVIAGEGGERRTLEALIESRDLRHAVHLIGHVPRPDAVLREADVFVSPSWAESFPYSLLDAMSFGLPIVATDVGGTREAIEDGVTGALVRARAPRALAGAITSLLHEPERGASLGAAAKARVGERFTLSAMVEGTLAVYSETGV